MITTDPIRRRRQSSGIIPPPRVATAVADLIDRIGQVPAADQLGLSIITVVRLGARLRVRAGSIALAAQRLGIDVEIPRALRMRGVL